jgi:hypothetical protein
MTTLTPFLTIKLTLNRTFANRAEMETYLKTNHPDATVSKTWLDDGRLCVEINCPTPKFNPIKRKKNQ